MSRTDRRQENPMSKLTRQEQLETMEEGCDPLANGDTAPEAPDWHAEILASRRRSIEDGSAVFLSLEAVKANQ